MNYTETNKLIAEFMGGEVNPNWDDGSTWTFNNEPYKGAGLHWTYDYIQYHTSWDWLMPVVEKIEFRKHVIPQENYSVEYYWDVIIERNTCIIKPDSAMVLALGVPIHFASYSGKLTGTYEAVVQFIHWYNTQNQK